MKSKDYTKGYRQRKGHLPQKINDVTRKKKTEKERRKYLEPKEWKTFKKKEAARVSEHHLKKCQSNCR